MAIPDHMLYRPPEWWSAREREYGEAYGRMHDPRFLIVPEPEPLPTWELRAIDMPLLLKRITRYNERQSTR